MAIVSKDKFFLEHVEELRNRIIKVIIGFIIASILSYLFVDNIFNFIVRPVGRLIFTSPAEAFLSRLNVALFVGGILSLPYTVFHIWQFVSVGLKEEEIRYVRMFAPWAVLLFVAGIGFAFFVIAPVCMRFFLSFSSDTLVAMISVRSYISFICSFIVIFALMFELPLAMMLLSRIGIISPDMLEDKRRYAVVIMLIIGAIITPSDVISQLLVAIPMIFLYELGIVFSKWICRKC